MEAAAHMFKSQHLRQRQVDFCKFEASLVYRGSSRAARGTQRNPDPMPLISALGSRGRLVL